MSIADGSYVIGPESGRLLVKTARTGLGAKAGHDLTIEATRWRGHVVISTASPGSSSVSVEVDVDSLEVREGTGGVKPLTDSDRADIRETFLTKILDASRHPAIAFASRRVSGKPESFTVEGDLTIMGVTHPLTVDGQLDGGHARGAAVVTQSRWGIRPYSAFLGALRLRDEVEILFELNLAAGT